MDTSVKYFHSELQGAPVLTGAAGSLIALLDACLVNGFGLKTVDTLVVSGGIATLTIGTGHSFEQDTVALISGATPAGLNGEKKIISASGNSATFDATGIANQTATGTITARLAAAGWSKAFSGTNLAAYRSSNAQANGRYLRVSDTAAQDARISGYETMTAISTGTNQFPSSTQQSGGLYITKSNTAGSTPRPWLVFADSRFVYFCIGFANDQYAEYRSPHGFGDIIQTSLGSDPYATCICGNPLSEINNAQQAYTFATADQTFDGSLYITRAYTGLGSSLRVRKHSDTLGSSISGNEIASGNVQSGMQYPNPSDNGLYLTNLICVEQNTNNFRGTFPGIYFSPQNIPANAFASKDRVQNASGLSGKNIVAVNTAIGSAGVIFFDVTGPWR